MNYKNAGRLDEAIPLLEKAYKSSGKYPTLAWVAGQLLDAYVKAGKPTEAARLATEQLAENRQRLKPGSPELGGLLAVTGKVLLDVDPVAAEPVLRECLTLRETLDPKAWNTANAKSLLGGGAALAEEVRRRRAAARRRLRGPESRRAGHSAAREEQHPRRDPAPGRFVRRQRDAGQSGEVAAGVGDGKTGGSQIMPDLPALPAGQVHRTTLHRV